MRGNLAKKGYVSDKDAWSYFRKAGRFPEELLWLLRTTGYVHDGCFSYLVDNVVTVRKIGPYWPTWCSVPSVTNGIVSHCSKWGGHVTKIPLLCIHVSIMKKRLLKLLRASFSLIWDSFATRFDWFIPTYAHIKAGATLSMNGKYCSLMCSISTQSSRSLCSCPEQVIRMKLD